MANNHSETNHTGNNTTNTTSNMTNHHHSTTTNSNFETAEAQMVEIRKALIAAQEAEDQQLCRRWRSKKESRNDTDDHNNDTHHHPVQDDEDDTSNDVDHGIAGGGNTSSPLRRRAQRRRKTKVGSVEDPANDDDDASSNGHDDDDDDSATNTKDNNVVSYHPHGGTKLFKAIEEQNWELAEQILIQHADLAAIWVISTGTVQTTFDWSLWKRLPLHEAVRRQPPAAFILNLLRAYPDAIRQRTQFGELPSHLAVECGASVHVIQLLCLYDWELCCTAVDQSGRTVLEVLKNGDGNVLDPDDQCALIDTLTATTRTYDDMQDKRRNEVRQLRQRHQAELEQLRLEHQQDMKYAAAKQTKLLHTVQSLHETIAQHEGTISQQNESLRQYDEMQDRWQHQYETIRQQQQQCATELVAERASTAALVQTIAGRDEHIHYLKEQIADLQTAVCRMAGWHETVVRPQLDSLRRQFELVNASYSNLQDHLLDHSDDLQTVLKELNIDAISENGGHCGSGGDADDTLCGDDDGGAGPGAASTNAAHGEANHHNNRSTEQDEEPVDDESAMVRVAKAASHVLE